MAPITSAVLLGMLALTSANTVQFDIQKNHAIEARQLKARSELNLQRRSLGRRASTVTATLGNAKSEGLYFANITVGTPPQKLALQIDTGSSDVWVPADTASQCSDVKAGGCPDGTFTHSKSSSFNDIAPGEFNISYVDGTGSTGDYFLDTFVIGGASLTNFQMGLATDTSIGTGIMGIGYESSEAILDQTNGQEYTNLPVAMVNQSLINSVAYSLWLNELQSSSGSVLFGGIDTKKYSGNLISVDVYPTSRAEGITSFTVAWTSLSATSSSGTDQLTPSDFAAAAILDSGTTITLLPDDLAQAIFEELGATDEPSIGAVIVPCTLAENTGTLNYQFGGVGGPTIQVAMSQLVLPLTDANGDSLRYNGQLACQLGIQAAGSDPVLFGDTFLRSAYVTYDLVNNRIALAQTDFNSTDSNVVAFASSGAPIPSATSAPNESSVTQTATGNPKVGGATATGTATSVTYNPTATGFSAEAGFTASATGSSSTSKKSAAGARPEPFRWSMVWAGLVSVALMGAGSGFILL